MRIFIRKLAILNIAYYINNYLYIIIETIFGYNLIVGAWSFSPYFFILFSTFIMEFSYKNNFKKIKIKATVDLVLRIVSLFINYYATTFDFQDIRFSCLILLEIFIMSINIYMEFKIYRQVISNEDFYEKVDNNKLSDKEIKKMINDYYFNYKSNLIRLGNAERLETNKIYKVTALNGYSKVLLAFLLVITGILLRILGVKFRGVILFFIIILYSIYMYISYQKFNTLYNEEKKLNRMYFKEDILLCLGLFILYISEGVIYVNTGQYNFFVFLIASLLCAPSIIKNNEISKRFHKINKKINKG